MNTDNNDRHFDLITITGVLCFHGVVWGTIGYFVGWMVWK